MPRVWLAAAFASVWVSAASAGETTAELALAISEQSRRFEPGSKLLRSKYRFVVYSRDGEVSQDEERDTLQVPGRGRAVVHRGPSLWETASGGNARYGFRLVRKADDWVVQEIVPPSPADSPSGHGALDGLFAFFGVQTTYHAALADPRTKLVRSGVVEWRGERRRELVLDTVMPNAYEGTLIRRRYGLFVPADGPAVVCGTRHYDPDNPAGWLTDVQIDSRPGDPLPVPERVQIFHADMTANYESWRVQLYEVREYERLATPPADREFTLSAFGLPEPKTVPKAQPHTPPAQQGMVSASPGTINLIPRRPDPPPEPWRPWWLLALVAGLLLVLAGVWASRRRRAG